MPDRWHEEFMTSLNCMFSPKFAIQPVDFECHLDIRRRQGGWDILLLVTEAVNGFHIEKSEVMAEIRTAVALVLTATWVSATSVEIQFVL